MSVFTPKTGKEFVRWFACTVLGGIIGAYLGAVYAYTESERKMRNG